MKKFLVFVIAIVLCAGILAACNTPTEDTPVSIATLSGPSGMGMAYMFDNQNFDISVFTAPDQISAKIIKGEIDIASVPANLAAVLYNKTDGGIKILSVNTLGMLYVIGTKDEAVENIADLEGKTLYATGRGATPEYVINEIIAKNEVETAVEYLAEHSALASDLIQGRKSLGVLPEPFVSMALQGNADLEIKIDLNEEWKALYGQDAAIPMTATIVRKAYLADNADKIAAFADAYRESVDKVNANPADAAELIATHEVFANKAVAVQAIPRCNIGYIDGENMQAVLEDYFTVLFDANPQAVGGSMPNGDIYA
ncbi:MAG: ABC transporter substrate-binding protein [Christensenellales bacterium]|jgi:NitT/TauT family transport system substrate-binding protein